MKKILIIHPAYWEQAFGGAELQIKYLIEGLKNLQCEIYYIYEDLKSTVENPAHINLVPIKSLNLRKSLGNTRFLYSKTLQKQIHAIGPDVIYTRGFFSWSGIAATYANKYNINHIWALASDNDLRKANGIKGLITKPLDLIDDFYSRKAYLKATHIITQNTFQQQMLKKLYNREGAVIPQAAPVCNKENILKKSDPISIVWIANLKPLKRPDLFINIAQHFRSDKNVKFFMIGKSQPQYKSMLDAAESDNFQYLGEMTNEAVNDFLNDAHVLINTSDYEGFSNTFIQAWMRKVVVVSMNSDPDEVIKKNKIGIVERDLTKLVIELKELLEDRELLERTANQASEYALRNHSLENSLNKVYDLMQLNH